MSLSDRTGTAAPVVDDAGWFGALLRDCPGLVQFLAAFSRRSLIAADQRCYPVVAAALRQSGAPEHVVPYHSLPLALAGEPAIGQVAVLSTENGRAARQQLRRELRARLRPERAENIELVGFFADLLPAMMTAKPAENLAFLPEAASAEPRLYAIVSTPRAGSTFLADLLRSAGLGNPIEHLRPWLIDLLVDRPAGLFDSIRFARRLIEFGRVGPVFGTKLISHFIDDVGSALTARETTYLRELVPRATIVYVHRRNKLDQAISQLRAVKTGIWQSTDPAYRKSRYNSFEYDFDEIASTLKACFEEERDLARALAGLSDVMVVDYDALQSAPRRHCQRIAARLGVEIAAEPSAAVQKLADAASERLARRFLDEATQRGVPVLQFLDPAPLPFTGQARPAL